MNWILLGRSEATNNSNQGWRRQFLILFGSLVCQPRLSIGCNCLISTCLPFINGQISAVDVFAGLGRHEVMTCYNNSHGADHALLWSSPTSDFHIILPFQSHPWFHVSLDIASRFIVSCWLSFVKLFSILNSELGC